MRKPVFICDVDNCISDDLHRMHHLPSKKYVHGMPISDQFTDADFHDYHMQCIFDKPHNLNQLPHDGFVLMVTAMPERYRLLRLWWFRQHLRIDIFNKLKLLMRPNGNHECSTVVKPMLIDEWLPLLGFDYDDVSMAIDDRQDVLNAYQEQFDFPTKRIVINE